MKSLRLWTKEVFKRFDQYIMDHSSIRMEEPLRLIRSVGAKLKKFQQGMPLLGGLEVILVLSCQRMWILLAHV